MLQLLSVPTIYRWLITLAFAAVVVVLSVTPDRAQAGDSIFVWLVVNTPTPLQKLMHVVVYAALALLVMWTLETIESRATRIAITLVATISFGAVLEWHQTRVPGRFGTLVDVLLNSVGTLVGLVLALVVL